jgi:hypothetical protein
LVYGTGTVEVVSKSLEIDPRSTAELGDDRRSIDEAMPP